MKKQDLTKYVDTYMRTKNKAAAYRAQFPERTTAQVTNNSHNFHVRKHVQAAIEEAMDARAIHLEEAQLRILNHTLDLVEDVMDNGTCNQQVKVLAMAGKLFDLGNKSSVDAQVDVKSRDYSAPITEADAAQLRLELGIDHEQE